MSRPTQLLAVAIDFLGGVTGFVSPGGVGFGAGIAAEATVDEPIAANNSVTGDRALDGCNSRIWVTGDERLQQGNGMVDHGGPNGAAAGSCLA